MADKLQTYEEAARGIALYLDEFCDKGLDYVNMIADASRRANDEIIKLRGRPDTKEKKLTTTNNDYAKCADEILVLDCADEVINKHGCLVVIFKRHFA